jgi:hypothetical protein
MLRCYVDRYLTIFWGIHKLLGNDRETKHETTAVVRQRPELQWTDWKAMVSAESAPMAVYGTVDIIMSIVLYAIRAQSL